MKIGIITFTYGSNYGNKLQNYALVNVLSKKYGKKVYTLKTRDYSKKYANFKSIIKKILKIKETCLTKRKQKTFNEFNRKYLNIYNIPLVDSKFIKFNDFDVFVCGSDQIWNPFYNKRMDIYTGNIIKGGVKRVSYAASIGVNYLSESDKENFIKNISTMHFVGVREKQGVELLNALMPQKDFFLELDPTLLLDKNEWLLIAKKPKKIQSKPYILTYFLKSMNSKEKQYIEKIATEKNYKVINLNSFSDKEWYTVSPNEFLWLINNAKYVFTDSFHAAVFSIVFEKNFMVFKRKSDETNNEQESRVLTLLSFFGLENRYEFKQDIDNYINYKKIKNELNKLRKESLELLFNSIE